MHSLSFQSLSHRISEFILGSEGRANSADALAVLSKQLFSLQYQHNPVLHSICEGRGISPANISDWKGIPAIPTEAFKEMSVSCIPADQVIAEFHSSGTSNQVPSRHQHHTQSLQLYEVSALHGFSLRIGPNPPSVILSLTPSPLEAPHSSLVHMFHKIISALGGPGSRFLGQLEPNGWGIDYSEFIAQVSSTSRPVLLMGTAFNFVHLLDHLEATGSTFSLPTGSQVLETGGYKGRSRQMSQRELHTGIGSRLGVDRRSILTEYGMSELSSQAYSLPGLSETDHSILRFPHWARALVVSAESGQEVPDGHSGILRILDLANTWSALMVQTSDLAIRRGEDFELIGRVSNAETRGCSLMAVPGV